jgi:hypothetical protein
LTKTKTKDNTNANTKTAAIPLSRSSQGIRSVDL